MRRPKNGNFGELWSYIEKQFTLISVSNEYLCVEIEKTKLVVIFFLFFDFLDIIFLIFLYTLTSVLIRKILFKHHLEFYFIFQVSEKQSTHMMLTTQT